MPGPSCAPTPRSSRSPPTARSQIGGEHPATLRGRLVLSGVGPAVLGRPARAGGGAAGGRRRAPEGAQVKVNMLLRRLPRLRDDRVAPEAAFAGTFHINETMSQLDAAHRDGRGRRHPGPAPGRDLLPLADRPVDPRPRAAGLRRPDPDAVRPAGAASARRRGGSGCRARGAAGRRAALARLRARRADRRLRVTRRPTARRASRRARPPTSRTRSA